MNEHDEKICKKEVSCDMDHKQGEAICAKPIFTGMNDYTYAKGAIKETKTCFSKLLKAHWKCTSNLKKIMN